MHPVIVFAVFLQLLRKFMRIVLNCLICVCTWLFFRDTHTHTHTQKKHLTHLFTHTCSYHSHVNTAAPHLCVPPPPPPPPLHLPSLTLSLFPLLSLCCCKAFPWLAVINLPSLGAGSWLRASEHSYKAKTAIQKQSRFSCFQSTT